MRRSKVFVVLIASLVFILGCGSGPAMDLEIPPPPLPLPEKTLPAVQVWEGTVVETLCLEMDWSLPQLGAAAISPADVPQILTNMGLKVVDKGSACDATLSIGLSGEALSGSYQGLGCVTGGRVQGQVSLSADGKAPFIAYISVLDPVDSSVYGDSCFQDPDRYNLNALCFPGLRASLAQIWGPEVYVWMPMSEWTVNWEGQVLSPQVLPDEISPEMINASLYALENESEPTRRAAAERLGGYAPDGEECIPYLIAALSDWEDGAWDAYAEALGEFGPQAVDAVPVLIIALRDELPEAWKKGMLVVSPDYKGKPGTARYPDLLAANQLKAIEVLQKITGEDYGTDVDAWARWWKQQ